MTPCKLTFKHSGQFGMGALIVSEKAFIHPGAELDLTDDIIVKDYANITEGVKIFTHKHIWNHSRGRRDEIERIEPVALLVEEDAYIGREAIVIAAKRIGKGAVVGAGAVLTKSVPDFEVWAGNPARKVGERKKDG